MAFLPKKCKLAATYKNRSNKILLFHLLLKNPFLH